MIRIGKKNKGVKTVKGRRRGRLTAIILVIVLIVSGIIALSNFITDWMWFSEMNYVGVFLKKITTQLKIGIPLFVVLTFLVTLYLNRIRKKYFKVIESADLTDLKRLGRYTRIVAVIFSAVVTLYSVRTLWFSFLEFTNSTDFKINDPLFGKDVSFYIFRLGFLNTLNDLLLGIIFMAILMVVVYYLVLIKMHTPDMFSQEAEYIDGQGGSGRSSFRGMSFNRNNFSGFFQIASSQITVLGVILFLMLAVDFQLKGYTLLNVHTGAVYGAGFVDVNIRLISYRILMALSVLGAIMVVVHMKKAEYKKIARIPIIMLVVVLSSSVIASVVQSLVVSTDELNKESKFLKYNIEYTQYAYNLNDVSIRKFNADNQLTGEDIKNNAPTISNIRINDYDPVKTFYNQTQSIRQYYTFHDVDVDRYMINNKLTQTYLAPREIDEEKISGTWLNRHLKYTHGYGLTLSKVNTVTASGQPDVLVKNIPPKTDVKNLEVTSPALYFGELTNDYSLVGTKEDEFDYPDGSKNKYSRYKGSAGIRMTPFKRLMFAIREKNLKLLVSTNINSDSKIIIYRNIAERVDKIMPYLDYDTDPYAVVDKGRVYWMIDAYTTSENYPYSEPWSEEPGSSNYVRNSVKVVIDAYNGDVSYYVIDKEDPIARTYSKIFPELFKDIDKMPEGLKSHVRYPHDLFRIQADIYSKYHMNNVKVFYQDEDRWDISDEIYGTKKQQMNPTYYIVKLPGEDKEEFISSIPFTPKSKQNMTALMIAGSDGEHYGKLRIYQFPKSKTVYGPMQVEAQIDQNTDISRDFSLWNSSGSKYSRGNLFVIPIKESLLYVEPVYLEASNSAIPEVKRVIVVFGDRIAYESTLGDALASMFGESGGTTTMKNAKSDADEGKKKKKGTMEYIKDAQTAYDNAQKSIKKGDWAEYGAYMKELEESLNKLDQ